MGEGEAAITGCKVDLIGDVGSLANQRDVDFLKSVRVVTKCVGQASV